jgi:serine-type D-Ala-D-Ala carboxypeptidase/endopeptidase (penicillin-binding protein 4)
MSSRSTARAARTVALLALALCLGRPTASLAEPPPGPSGAKTAAPAGPHNDNIAAAVRAIASSKALDGAKVGVMVIDVRTGAVLGASEEHTLVNPASNAKIYTAAAALAILHGSHRYHTTLRGSTKGTSASGLVLRGDGDPSLQSRDLWDMAQALKAHGVRRVDGDILVDQGAFDAETTPPAFDQQPNEWAAFRAPVSAVAVNENTVTLTVRPTKAGEAAIATFDPPGFVDVTGAVKTGESGADTVGLALAGAGDRLSAKLSGAVAEDSRLVRYTRRVEDPRLLAGYALRAILDECGVKVTGDVKLGSAAKGRLLARHESEPLSTLLLSLGKASDNFYAEMIFKSLGGEAKGRPAKSQDAAEVVTKWLERNGLGDKGLVIKNGSGLFDANRVTAYSAAQVLRYALRDPATSGEFLAQLAIGGVDGTLHRRFRGHKASYAIRAKTGTLDDAIALSGYVLPPATPVAGKLSGPVAFVFLANGVKGRGGVARGAADKLVEAIYAELY